METPIEIQEYFEACVKYWIRCGNSPAVATSKALWWDCCEIWNVDKSWNIEKIKFINRYRHYEPYGEIPTEESIEKGA